MLFMDVLYITYQERFMITKWNKFKKINSIIYWFYEIHARNPRKIDIYIGLVDYHTETFHTDTENYYTL